MLRKLLKLNIDDLALYAGVEGGLFLLIHLVAAGVMFFAKESSAPLVCGVVMPITAVLLVLICCMAQVGVNFDMALRFGQTRRRALAQAIEITVIHGLLAMALAVLLAGLERLFAPRLWMGLAGKSQVVLGAAPPIPEPGLAPDGGMWLVAQADTLYVEPFTLDWWWYPLLLAAGIAAGLVLGAMMQRFGGKGLWIIWGVCMAPMILGQLLPRGAAESTAWIVPLLVIVFAAAFLWSIWSVLHAAVRS